MNIYHLTRHEPIAREENAALVLIAATEYGARARAAALCGPEGEDAWLKRAHIERIGTATDAWAGYSHAFACIDCLEA